jgi:hypothetical protein
MSLVLTFTELFIRERYFKVDAAGVKRGSARVPDEHASALDPDLE